MNGRQQHQFHEGWVLHHQASRTQASAGLKKWTRYMMVLQDRLLLMFSSEKKSSETMVGTLTLGPATDVRNVFQDVKDLGFCFELKTMTDAKEIKTNIFMCEKANERDLWKAFILGVARGAIPTDVSLQPGQLNSVRDAVRQLAARGASGASHPANPQSGGGGLPRGSRAPAGAFAPGQRSVSFDHGDQPPPEVDSLRDDRRRSDVGLQQSMSDPRRQAQPMSPSGLPHGRDPRSAPLGTWHPGSVQQPQFIGGFSDGIGQQQYDPRYPTRVRLNDHQYDARYPAGMPGASEVSHRESPAQVSPPSGLQSPGGKNVHLFYNNPALNLKTPSWYVECTREKAEAILSMSRQYGSLLMRPVGTEPNTKYAISYRMEVGGGCQVRHYAVVGSVNGFKIDVYDEFNGRLSCLSDVIEYFVSRAGPSARPLSADLATILAATSLNSPDRIYSGAVTVGPSRMAAGRQPATDSFGLPRPTVAGQMFFGAAGGPELDNRTMNGEDVYANGFQDATDALDRAAISPSTYANGPYNKATSPTGSTRSSRSTGSRSTSSTSQVEQSWNGSAGTLSSPVESSPPPSPPPPPPPPPPVAPPPAPLVIKKGPSTEEGGNNVKSPKGNGANDLQRDLQKELQLKVSKYRKATYTPATAPKMALVE